MTDFTVHDPYCKREPKDIPSVALEAKIEGLTPEVWVVLNEGTYNRVTGEFACDECYIRLGQPSSPTGWVAGPGGF